VLDAEHVDQEAERAEIAGEAIKGAGLRPARQIDLGLQQGVDIVAHAQRGLRRLIQAEHRKHAAHRLQLPGYRRQHLAFGRVAEVLIDQLFGFGERGAHLVDHAAERLALGDATVQILHPAFERPGRLARTYVGDALGELGHALALLGRIELAVVERGIEIEQARRHLHRERGRRRSARMLGLRDRCLQFVSEHFACRHQPAQRIADERKLFGQAGQAVNVTAGNRAPGVLGARHALLRLPDEGGIEATENARVVIRRRFDAEVVALADRRQARRMAAGAGRIGLRTEEQQILREAV
jgi:hypothetical protein